MKQLRLLLLISFLTLTGCTSKGEVITTSPLANDSTSDIVVEIKGAVKYPGIYILPSTALVNDVITLAGGVTSYANLSNVSLVGKLANNQMIYIPSHMEGGTTTSKLVNINAASLAELMTLPGIGESKAQSVIEYRNKVGGYHQIEDIMKVPGIGEAMFAKIKDYISVS